MAEMDEKRQQIAGKLERREEERIIEIQKRKSEKDNQAAANENVDLIKEKFMSAEKRLVKSLEDADTVDKSTLTEYFEGVVNNFQILQKFLTDSTLVLPSYDVQRFQASLAKLQISIQEKKEAVQPKKKFAFKSKKKTTEKPDSEEVTPTDHADGVKSAKKLSEINYSYSDISNENLSMLGNDVLDKDIAIARLSQCVVKLYGSPRALRFDGMQSCQVFCGPVAGSIFIDDCKDCIFILACQQLRVHHTTDTQFYLHVTSRGIIEDSNAIGFAPFNWSYPELDEHYNVSQLDKSRNTWNDIDDFNWLASDTHSPNWYIIPENERKSSWEN